MASDKTSEWMSKLIERGEDVNAVMNFLKEISVKEQLNAERDDRRAQRELESREKDRELEYKKIQLREKEIALKEAESKDEIKTKVKLPKFHEGEDIEVFLTSFERLATLHRWPKPQWPVRLVPQLSGKALEAYSRMSITESKDYDKIKRAILDRYGLNSWEYRDKFRQSKQLSGETFKEYAVRIRNYFEHWQDTEAIHRNYDALVDLMLREQLTFSASPNLQTWIREHQPNSVENLVTLSEAYQLAHKEAESKRSQFRYQNRNNPNLNKNMNDQPNNESSKSDASIFPKTYQSYEKRKCFICDSTEHLIAKCPFKVKETQKEVSNKQGSGQASSLMYSPTKDSKGKKQYQIPVVAEIDVSEINLDNGLQIVKGCINGKEASMLRDTGATTIFVSDKIIPKEQIGLHKREVTLANGETQLCPEVVVNIQSPYISATVDALVLNNPFADVVIGNIGNVYPSKTAESAQIITRSMAKNEESVEQEQIKLDSKWKSDDYEVLPEKEGNSLQSNILSEITSCEDLITYQESDTTLDNVRKFACQDSVKSRNACFFFRNKILYRAFHSATGEVVNQIVVPKAFRLKILEIAHDTPCGGHMGCRKTRNRIMQNFFWPGIFIDVAKFCRSCPKCQKSVSKGRASKAKLCPIPPMAEPFTRVAIDIIGPLIRTKKGYRYILTLCDYSTKYPEAVPLKVTDTETIANALIEIFSRTGIPKEILSDQGSNLTSSLMKELCKLLHIKKITSTPYHPEANGLVERFNGTLKRMLTCFVENEKDDWDKYLPYLLFSYREVPQESTGFSPFELLYGRYVRGPLSILKEEWEEPQENKVKESVVSYLLKTREMLAKMSDIAHSNEDNSKRKQKLYYDRKKFTRKLSPGQKVCVLLPTSTSKLLADWKGPYEVLKQVSPVDYEIQLNRKVKKTFHINMLKEWIDRNEDSFQADAAETPSNMIAYYENTGKDAVSNIVLGCDDDINNVVSIENPLLTPTESISDIKINDQLDKNQINELQTIFQSFSDVLTDVPGKTNLIDHDVVLKSEIPVAKKAYMLPYSLREKVKQEIDNMVEAGIAEKSSSPYASPIVIVPKKDGTIRLCVDYRQLNEITIFDPQPMPKLEDIINKLGKAKYLSKIDLTKGFWQIPLSHSAQIKSSFVTPFGQFQFKVMPFGMINSSATFVRLMKMILANFDEFSDSFIDDIIIFSESWPEHLCHIRSVLKALREASLTAKPSKCEFGFEEIEFLAHKVGRGEVHPLQRKIDAINSIPSPTTKKQVRSFIGMIGFYRRFIPHFAEISACLTDLTKKSNPNKVRWLPQHQIAFDKLKHALVSYPVLQNPDFTKEFVLQTDACDRGTGAVLLQSDGGDLHPIVFISSKLLPREQRYSIVEKECLAIVKACYSLKEYLIGKEFAIETDHYPLQWLNKMKDNNMRLLRWSLMLQEYRFVIRHISGKHNVIADMLSRNTDI